VPILFEQPSINFYCVQKLWRVWWNQLCFFSFKFYF